VKSKDIAYLVLAVVILLVAAYIGVTKLGNKPASAQKGVQVEVVGAIPSSFDSGALTQLNDPTQVKDSSSPIDFSGLNNTSPFGR
jgi:hypothetical protein